MTGIFNLTAKPHQSRVLTEWAAAQPGFAARMGHSVRAEQVSISSSDAEGMLELFAPIKSASGFAVNDRSAMTVGTLFACMQRLSGAAVQLPVHHYKLDTESGERTRAFDSAIWWLLNEQPHRRWSAAKWKEWIVRCVHLRGDQHTLIQRSSYMTGGKIIGFEPLHPDYSVARCVSGGNVYDVMDRETGRLTTYDQDDILHFSGFGFDGLRSISAVQQAAKQAIGNSLAAAEYSGKALGEGGMPQIALKYPVGSKMDEKQKADLRESFKATYGGQDGRRLPLVLTNGGDVKELSISPVDLELIASRKFEKQTICEVMGVPPVLIGDSEKTSSWGTGIEQITIGFVKFTVAPMCRGWQEEINRKVFRRAGQFVEFEFDGLQRGDSKSQSETFKAALGGPGTGDGYMTVNEVRRIKNMPPVPGGDELFKAQRGTVAPPPKEDPEDPAKEPA